MTPPLALEDAQARLLALLSPVPAREYPVDTSARLFLAEPVIARRSQPSADLSAMDGYATAGDGPWDIVGEARAGAPFPKMLATGLAVRISTGAHMPHGADAVLVQEEAQVDGDRLTALAPPQERFIRRAGLDFAASDMLLEPGTRMGAAQIALARAGGLAEVVAHDRPLVAIIECGDELHADPAACGPDGIPATNGAMLRAMAREAGAEPHAADPVPDEARVLVCAIEQASDSAPLVVVSGGASVGPHDLVKPALEAAGFSLDFWRVAIKPGKPLAFGTLGNARFFGLPGNPVSTAVTFIQLVRPALVRMAGGHPALPIRLDLPTLADLRKSPGRENFLRARLVTTDAGRLAVEPIDHQGSGVMRSMSSADCFIVLPAPQQDVPAGEMVTVEPFAQTLWGHPAG